MDGLIRHRKGRIELNGKEIKKMQRKDIAKYMAYVPQSISNIFPFKVFDMVLQGRYPHRHLRHDKKDLEKAFNALRLMGAEDLAMRDFGAISGGQRQKVTMARAIAQEAEVLLLDEPTSNLDIMHQLEVMELLRYLVKQNEISAVVTLHDLNLAAKYADTVILLNQGKIIASGDPCSVLTSENIASVYHVEAVVNSVQDRPHIIPIKPLSTHSCRRLNG